MTAHDSVTMIILSDAVTYFRIYFVYTDGVGNPEFGSEQSRRQSNTRHEPIVAVMSARRLQRWPNVTTTLCSRVVFSVFLRPNIRSQQPTDIGGISRSCFYSGQMPRIDEFYIFSLEESVISCVGLIKCYCCHKIPCFLLHTNRNGINDTNSNYHDYGIY